MRPPRAAPRLIALGLASLALPLALTASDGGELIVGDGDLEVVPRTAAELARMAPVLAPVTDFSRPEPYEAMPAGAASTRRRASADAFSDPSANVSFAAELDFKVGNGLFKKLWVSAPSSTLASDGLGPLFNSRSCQTCHLKDGRGHPPAGPDDGRVSMVMALYRWLGQQEIGAGTQFDIAADPAYGDQLQDLSLAGLDAEGRLEISYAEIERELEGGEKVSLRAPRYAVGRARFGPLAKDTTYSVRVAPQMIGLGLLEAIPAADILAGADPNDSDGDGISGVARLMRSPEHDLPLLGRFGYKAAAATIRQQSAKAMHTDIGLSNPLHPAPWGDCTTAQARCRAAPHGDDAAQDGFEVNEEALALITFYSRNLGVPQRVDVASAEVLAGKELFHQSGCASCHRPKYVTHRLEDQPEQSFQLIWPYTDMLLHDMGEGLADQGAVNPLAREWRTAPLWGIGLVEQVNGHTFYLHDGRARNLTEAILWHGGEAQASQEMFVAMSKDERAKLLRFLNSL